VGKLKIKKLFYGLIALALFMITGCNIQGGTTTVSIDSIDAEEVLTLDSDADIFQYDGVIYKTNIDWVEELSLTKDVQIGEIKKMMLIQILEMRCRINFLLVQRFFPPKNGEIF